MPHLLPTTRQPSNGMGMAVAKRTIFRKQDCELWELVADRVAYGNISLVSPEQCAPDEYGNLRAAIASGAFLTSGRHLQHGDYEQKDKPMELFTNCSTAATSFLLFYLLLNGSGVGRSYDDSLMLVDWANAPKLTIVLSTEHPDFPKDEISAQEFLSSFMQPSSWSVKHNPLALFYNIILTKLYSPISNDTTVYHYVADSREGWAAAFEIYETMAFEKDKRELILDFSGVRQYGAPIHGMQERPASGPLSLIRAFLNIEQHVVAPAKRDALPRWLQAMRVDHYLSMEVQVGGARRAARMSTKDWRDPDILQFIEVKSKGGLWTSNNSVMVDAEFWQSANTHGTRAKAIFEAVTENAYYNGEPGFINGDSLEDAKKGLDRNRTTLVVPESKRFKVTTGRKLFQAAAQATHHTRFATITNPCVSGDTLIKTEHGLKKVSELVGSPFVAIVDGLPFAASGFWCTGNRPVVNVVTLEGHRVIVTIDHEILTIEGWKPASLLRQGDSLLCDGTTAHATVDYVEPAGEIPVFDCHVEKVNCYIGNELYLHNCGEIPLHVLGGYCVIGDFAPLLSCPVDFSSFPPGKFPKDICAAWDKNVAEVVALGVRFLMRVNLMDSLYSHEVSVTNRIGIGPTGLHEYAWVRYGLTFNDLLNKEKSKGFWQHIASLSCLAKLEANTYAQQLHVAEPVTVTTCKPAGTTSKLYGLSEGAHLPARRRYIRWVQFRGWKLDDGTWESTSDPLLAKYEAEGYWVRELKSFPGMSIVGFPTETLISSLGLGDALVTAHEASPEDQYKWLRLLEEHWLGYDRGNQISYTLKFPTHKYSLTQFRKIMLENQPFVRCCTILPSKTDAELPYEYLPEEDISLEFYEMLINRIRPGTSEDIDIERLRCDNGACPL